MKMYTVTAMSVALVAGVLGLTLAQALPRAHNLQVMREPKRARKGEVDPDDRGEWRIVREVQFKRGETFGYDGPLPKALAECLTDAAEAAAAAEAAQREREREHAAAFHAGLRAGLITAAMNGCTKLGAVTADGKPDPAVLSQLAGFSPSVEEMQQALAASEPQG